MANRFAVSDPALEVQEEDSQVAFPVTNLNFEGDVSVTDDGSGKATVVIGEGGQFTGKLADFLFSASGNTSDKWVGIGNGSTASNTLPLIIPQDAEISALTFSNQDDNVDIDIELYINGTLDFTWEIRNKRTAWKTDLISMSGIVQGDRISCFLRKYTGGTGDTTAQDPVIEIFLVYTGDNEAEGGTQYGV